jgi:hypothetical protein
LPEARQIAKWSRSAPPHGVVAALGELQRPSPTEAVETLRAGVAEFATDGLTDDLCLLAARFN